MRERENKGPKESNFQLESSSKLRWLMVDGGVGHLNRNLLLV